MENTNVVALSDHKPVGEYHAWQNQIVEDAKRAKMNGLKKPDITQLTIGLDLDKDNSIVRTWALENGITATQWHRAILRLTVTKILGAYPKNPSDLVRLFVEYDRVKCSFDGAMRQSPRTYRDYKGDEVPFAEGELEALSPEERSLYTIKVKSTTNVVEFVLRIKVFCANYDISYSDSIIENAVMYWYEEAQRERLEEIFIDIQHARIDGNACAALWRDLVLKTFDCSETSPEFVAAVLRKFVWQVKRKILNLDITGHLMPVLLGDQGAGKSRFVELLIAPVTELVKKPDFADIGDNRNIDLWKSYVFFIDEMSKASRADVDTIKNRITASSLDQRPMRTNGTVQIRNCATMIGNSNKAMEQLIVDPTGIRRFAPLTFLPREIACQHWAYTGEYNFARLWRTVDEHGPDPMEPFAEQLRQVQADNQAYGAVETWLRDLSPATVSQIVIRDGLVLCKNLWDRYSIWEDDTMPGAHKMSFTAWRSEMKRMIKTDNKGARYGFTFDSKTDRVNTGMCFRYEKR